jgi:hypothetical protein
MKQIPESELQKRYEIHYIIPYHAGGTDDIENLIPLTPPDHALAHYYLYWSMKIFGSRIYVKIPKIHHFKPKKGD